MKSSSPLACKIPLMTREALAEELSGLFERYHYSARALEVFVKDSLEGIDRSRASVLELLEKVRGSRAGEELIVESGPDTRQIKVRAREFEVMDSAVSDFSRYYKAHPQMLLEMSLIYAGALFDALISDALLAVLRHIPERLRSG
jgi:hypothetical protein